MRLLRRLCFGFVQNRVSHCSGERIFIYLCEKCGRKAKNGDGRPYVASVMGLCGGLVGPKSGNVEKVLVFKASFEGSRGADRRQEDEQTCEPELFLVEKATKKLAKGRKMSL